MRTLLFTILFILTSASLFARSAYRVEGNNVVIQLDAHGIKSNILVVELWSTNTVRIISSMSDTIADRPAYFGERGTSNVKFTANYVQNNIEIVTSKLMISVQENGLVSLLNREGRKMMIESDRSFTPSEKVEGTYTVNQKFFLNRKEFIYGFGHDGITPRYNLREQQFNLIQDNKSTAMPVVFSEKGFAFIWENFSETSFNDQPSGMSITSEVADEISYFFIYENNWNSLLYEIRTIFGNAVLLPQWAYGFHLNPNAYQSKQGLNNAIEKYHSLGINVETQSASNELLNEEKTVYQNNTDYYNKNIAAFTKLKNKFDFLLNNQIENHTVIPTHVNIPGIQRYGVYTVAGDIESSWKALKAQVGAGITSSFTGQLHWSTPIGGLLGNTTDDSRNELLTRWYQFAAFTPVFQGGINADIWSVGNADSQYFKAIANSIQLRYQLMPYIYSSAWSAVNYKNALFRSILFDFQNEKTVLDIDQQFFFGNSLMVCPVTSQGAKTQKIVFPENTNWYNFYTGKKIENGKTIDTQVSIDNIPVFVKEGSIIPVITAVPNDTTLLPIEIRVYTGANAEFTLYEDENDGMGYLKNKFTKISLSYAEKSRTLTIGSPEGELHGKSIEKLFRIALVSEANATGLKEASEYHEILYKGKRTKVKL